jgi:hypothetical protein
MDSTQKFSFHFYFKTLIQVMGEPRNFFSELPSDSGFLKPLFFLIISCTFFTGACVVSTMSGTPVYLGSILFVNAVGMVLIASGLGYMVMRLIQGRSVSYKRFFSIYAFSSGTTLLVAWIPFSIWVIEPWKWWLIGTGMSKSCGFKIWQIVLIIGLSVIIMILLFRAVMPFVSPSY